MAGMQDLEAKHVPLCFAVTGYNEHTVALGRELGREYSHPC